jgi:hypothetical protein
MRSYAHRIMLLRTGDHGLWHAAGCGHLQCQASAWAHDMFVLQLDFQVYSSAVH